MGNLFGDNMPKRLRRSRKLGYRIPHGAIYVGRPTRWGNPRRADMFADYSKADCVADFRRWIMRDGGTLSWDRAYWTPPTMEEIVESLRGKDLVCWCPLDGPCHADVLLQIANTDPDKLLCYCGSKLLIGFTGLVCESCDRRIVPYYTIGEDQKSLAKKWPDRVIESPANEPVEAMKL